MKDLFLSIPGGGVRGALTVRPLLRLEKQTGKLCREIFKGVAGTSTGSDLAAAIAAGIPCEQIAAMYREDTPKIFNHSSVIANALLLKRGYKYDVGGLHRVLEKRLGTAGACAINSFSTLLLITARGVDGHQWYFTQDRPNNTGGTGQCKLIDCCVASSAAPIYFQPYTIPGIGALVDGGVGVAGNPVYELAVEAFEYAGFKPENSAIVSIGTGKNPVRKDVPNHNLVAKLSWIIGMLLDAPEALAPVLVRRHYPQVKFDDFDIQLKSQISMDQAANVPELEQYGERLADQIDWDEILAA
jgi:uncharacterized protein